MILKHLKKLKTLGLDDTGVTDAGMIHVAELADSLEEIHLFRTSVGDEGIAHLAKCSKLFRARLRDTSISSDGLKALAGKKMRILDLSETNIDDDAMETIKSFTELEDLSLWYAFVTDTGVESLSGLTKLKKLSLESLGVSDVAIAHLKPLVNLESLHLGANQITDESLNYLTGMKKLKMLYVTENPSISQDAMNALKAEIPGLTIIY